MTTALTKPHNLTPDIWKMIINIAPTMHQSRLFGVSSPEQAAVIMLHGYELGLPLTAALDFITTIQGKSSLSPRGALAIAQNSGELEAFKVEDLTDPQGNPTKCRVTGKRRGGNEYMIEVSMEDAKRAGLVKPGSGWESWPANMLRWRAIGFWLDVIMPDVIGGMKRADEFNAVITPDGDVIDMPAFDAYWPAPPHTEQAPDPLTVLVERYSIDEITAANGGTLPETDDEIADVARKLASG